MTTPRRQLLIWSVGLGILIWGISASIRTPPVTPQQTQQQQPTPVTPPKSLTVDDTAKIVDAIVASHPVIHVYPDDQVYAERQRQQEASKPKVDFDREQEELDILKDKQSCPGFLDAPIGFKKCPERDELAAMQKLLDARRKEAGKAEH